MSDSLKLSDLIEGIRDKLRVHEIVEVSVLVMIDALRRPERNTPIGEAISKMAGIPVPANTWEAILRANGWEAVLRGPDTVLVRKKEQQNALRRS